MNDTQIVNTQFQKLKFNIANMKIVPIHYKISKPVVSYKEINEEAKLMKRFIVFGDFKGIYNKAFAIAHCQVSETPMSFFVVSPEVVTEKMFESQVIINPQIIEANEHRNIVSQNNSSSISSVQGITTIRNVKEYQEPCMSFPFRRPKTVLRYDVIRVKYQIKSIIGLKTIEKELSGLVSEIFQHEFDHMQGKNIYFATENPVKWWELVGQPKSIGGTSLDV